MMATLTDQELTDRLTPIIEALFALKRIADTVERIDRHLTVGARRNARSYGKSRMQEIRQMANEAGLTPDEFKEIVKVVDEHKVTI